MFKEKKREAMTAYERRRSMMANRLMCLLATGVLLYNFVQSFFESDPMPAWFPVVMIALIAGCTLLLLWNIKMVKEFDREQAEIEKQQELQKTAVIGCAEEAAEEESAQ